MNYCSCLTAHKGDRYGSSPLHSEKFLVFTIIVARCLCVCKVAREPSGKKWNYLSKVCHIILQQRPLPGHLCPCFLPQIYDKRSTMTLRLC